MTEHPRIESHASIAEVLDEFGAMLATLEDDLAAARRERTSDYEDSGREVLQASSWVAQALVDALPSMDIPYDELDEVLRAIAARDLSVRECADLGVRVFEFLRKSSYAGRPDPDDAPDMNDFSERLRGLPIPPDAS